MTETTAGALNADDLGRTVRFRSEAATYEGVLTHVQHGTYGLADTGRRYTMLSVRHDEWFAHRTLAPTDRVLITTDGDDVGSPATPTGDTIPS